MKPRVLFLALVCCFSAGLLAVAAAPDPLAIAEEEALRRQERQLVMEASIQRANRLLKEKDFANAAKLYEEAIGHARLLSGFAAAEKGHKEAQAGLAHCRLQMAIALQEKYQFDEAAAEVDKLAPYDPNNKDAEAFKRFNETVKSAHRGRLPSSQVVTRQTELMEQRSDVMRLVKDGQAY